MSASIACILVLSMTILSKELSISFNDKTESMKVLFGEISTRKAS